MSGPLDNTMIRRIVAVAGLLLCLALINWKIVEKEDHLATGQIVLLRLAPVDPRSLMQGDFMALRYEISAEITRLLRDAVPGAKQNNRVLKSHDGVAYVTLDQNNVARLIAIQLDGKQTDPVPSSSVPMQFRVRDNDIKLATNAFFFQEGTGQLYDAARYGKFRVNKTGELLLTDLVDDQLQVLGAAQ